MSLDESEGTVVLALLALGAFLLYKASNVAGAATAAYTGIPAGGTNPPGQTIGQWWSNMFSSGFTNSTQPTAGPEVVMAVTKTPAASADLTSGSVTTGTILGNSTTPDFSNAASGILNWGIPQANDGTGGAY